MAEGLGTPAGPDPARAGGRRRGAAAARRLAAALLLLPLSAAPAAATGVLAPDWPSPPRDAPVDLWRLGDPPLPFSAALRDRGWTPLDFVVEVERTLTVTEALRARTAPRRETGETSPLERLMIPEDTRIGVEATDEIVLSGRARVPAAAAPPTMLERDPAAPPERWEIRSPSYLHEVMRVAPPELAEASRLGLTDLLTTGMTVHVAPGEATPDWAEEIRAESDPVTRGLSLAQPAPRPLRQQSDDFVGVVVLVALAFGAVALGGIVYAIAREVDGPKKLRSRRFG